MYGPRKENATKKISIPTPTMARRLLANSRSASRQPLRTGPMSPPSGPRSIAGVRLAIASLLSGQPDPGIRHGQRDIRDEIADHRQERSYQRVCQQYRIVLVTQGVIQQQAQAG